MSTIHDAIVEILQQDASANAWATGGIHARYAGSRDPSVSNSRRDKYIVVKVEEGDPVHQQVGASRLMTEAIAVLVWAHSGADVSEGANRVRWALDAKAGTAAGLTIQRIFWRGSPDVDDEDADQAEQKLIGARCLFDVAYVPNAAP